MARADGAQPGLDLDVHERLVVVDVEHRLGGVVDAPHHVAGDVDRVAAFVVDLDALGMDVVRPDRELLLAHPRPDPAQSLAALGALVFAEQRDHDRLVGLDHKESEQREQE
ncbi:hypothetical protein D3C83_38920 [compost metagenome]